MVDGCCLLLGVACLWLFLLVVGFLVVVCVVCLLLLVGRCVLFVVRCGCWL